MFQSNPVGPTLFDKNLVYLDTALPGIAAMARQGAAMTAQMATRAVYDAGGRAVDIDLGNARLYGGSADTFAREQVSAWLNEPMRLFVNRPEPDTLIDVRTRRLAERLERTAGDALTALPPLERTGLLIVVGIGLGLHLLDLVARLGPRHIVLVEPIGEFVMHSLGAIDWRTLAGGGDNPDTTLDVIAGLDPRETQKQLEELMARFGAHLVDGAGLYLHYRTDDTLSIARAVQELAGVTALQQGYFDDETLMIENTVANAVTHDFRLVDGTFQAPHDLPAFIVGSGPSLDSALDAIGRQRDRAVVFSAGSALQSLLAAGIEPDFHVEKENNEVTEARIAHIFERTRGSRGDATFGVDLMAAVTVKPGVVACFDDHFLFHRDSLSSTRLFANGHEPVVATGPFSANTALALAVALGFRRIYLFGCDCGTVDRLRHHATETVYNTQAGHPQGHADMPVAVPANFGGEVWTNRHYVMSRWVLESMIANAGVAAVNCSDGAAIAGAAPVRPDALEVAGSPIDKAAVKKVIRGMYRHYRPGMYLTGEEMSGVVRDLQAFAGDFRSFLDGTLPVVDDLAALDRALGRFLDNAEARYGGLAVWLNGSVRGMVPVAGYYLNRARDGDVQRQLMAAFRDACRAEIDDMLDEAAAVLARMAEHVAGGADLRRAG